METTLFIKVPALADRLRELNLYDTVEIVVLPADVERSDPRYVAVVSPSSSASMASPLCILDGPDTAGRREGRGA